MRAMWLYSIIPWVDGHPRPPRGIYGSYYAAISAMERFERQQEETSSWEIMKQRLNKDEVGELVDLSPYDKAMIRGARRKKKVTVR